MDIFSCVLQNQILPGGQRRYLQWTHVPAVTTTEQPSSVSLHHVSLGLHHLPRSPRGDGLCHRGRAGQLL